MQKFIILQAILVLTSAVVIGSTECTCNNYAFQQICSSQICIWNVTSSTCSEPTVQTATNAGLCYKAEGVWTPSIDYQGPCTTFTSCDAIALTSQASCSDAYPMCTWISGTTCSPQVQALPECETYMTASECNGNIQLDGFCYFTPTGTCAVATSCSQFSIENCPVSNACQIVAAFGSASAKCAPATCAGFKSSVYDCTYVSDSISFTTSSVTACALTTTTPIVCINAPSPSVLNTPFLCSTQTANTYTWSSNDPSQGSCISCQVGFMFAVFAFAQLLA